MEPPPLSALSPRATHRRIAADLRHRILEGQLAPGTRLPSTAEIAAEWKASDFTVYTALQSLVKEGLVQRIRRAGSYVANPDNRFTCAGIYLSSDIVAGRQNAFMRRLYVALRDNLQHSGIEIETFVESRPEDRRKAMLPSLVQAILHRRIQCIIAPTLAGADETEWLKLRIPTAFSSLIHSPNRVFFDMEGYVKESVDRLAAQGCRSIGVINNIPAESPSLFYPTFRKVIHARGLVTRDEWIRKGPPGLPDFETYGYEQFRSLWRQDEKPDGLIIYPDEVVRGALIAILDEGRREVTSRMKFVFHRNLHLPYLCPFPVIWGISDEDQMANELVRFIMRQFQGQKNAPVAMPFAFEYH